MTRLAIDPATAVRLAALDPALADLPDVLAGDATRADWQLSDVRWVPGEGCRLAFRVAPEGDRPSFVGISVSGGSASHFDYRDDRALRGAVAAADPREVTARLSSSPAATASWQVEPVRYRPGSRCVWRYELDADGARTTLYAKAFDGREFARQRALVDVLEPPRRLNLVPGVTAVWPDLDVIVSTAIEGRPLSSVLTDAAGSVIDLRRLSRRVGSLLADFHRQPADQTPRYTAADQLATLDVELAALRLVEPALGERIARIVEDLVRSTPEHGRPVLAHGAFRAGQVIVGSDGSLTLIDTDGVSRADPARDLGRALAHLTWQAIRHPGQRAALQEAERGLLDGYAHSGQSIDEAALRWWRAVALLQLAARRYGRIEHGDWPRVALLVDEAERLRAPRRRATAGAIDLLDVDVATRLVQSVLGPGNEARPIRVISADHLATRSRRRTVVRYRVTGMANGHPLTIIGKSFADDDHATRLEANLRTLAHGPFRHAPFRVPQPLGLLPEHRLVLFSACDGVPLEQVTAQADAEQGVRSAARWLAQLHGANVDLPRRFSLDEEAEATGNWASRIGGADGRLASRARRLAEGWIVAIGPAATDGFVPIHKDFHPGHVLIGDDTSVIDLDEARLGSAALDIAHFCAYLELQSMREGTDPSLTAAFIEEYVARTRWADTASLNGFRAYAWLKIAKQWAVGSGPGQGASQTARLTGAATALARGETCLLA